MATSLIHQQGQAMLEYTIICTLLATALFLPLDNPLAMQLIHSLQNSYQNFSFALSLPQ